MKFGFMSSVCPALTVPGLIAKATQHGFQHLELRTEWGHRHGVELDTPASELDAIRSRFEDSDIALSCLATGVKFSSPHRREREEQAEKLKRYIAIAARVNASHVRIFGAKLQPGDIAPGKFLDWQIDWVRALDSIAGEAGVRLVLETHGTLTAGGVSAILYQSGAQHSFANWHPAHDLKNGLSIEWGHALLSKRIRHMHINLCQPYPKPHWERDAMKMVIDTGYPCFTSIEAINPADADGLLAAHARLIGDWFYKDEPTLAEMWFPDERPPERRIPRVATFYVYRRSDTPLTAKDAPHGITCTPDPYPYPAHKDAYMLVNRLSGKWALSIMPPLPSRIPGTCQMWRCACHVSGSDVTVGIPEPYDCSSAE